MTIDQTEVILAAFDRRRAACEQYLDNLKMERAAMKDSPDDGRLSLFIMEARGEVETWRKAVAIVRLVAEEVKP